MDVVADPAAIASERATGSPRVAPRQWTARVVLAWGAWAVIVAGIAAIAWLDHLLRGVGRGDLTALTDAGMSFVVGGFVAATVGALIAARTGHPVSWLLLALSASVVASGFAQAYGAYGVVAEPGAVPAAAYVAPWSEAAFFLTFGWLAVIMLLTPTGRPPSRRWGLLVPVAVGGAVLWTLSTLLEDAPNDPPLQDLANPMAVQALQPTVLVLMWIGIMGAHGGVIAAGVSLVRRFRRAADVERQQLRWVAFGAAISAVAAVGAFIGAAADQDALLGFSAALLVSALPGCVAIAISRWRLYDLDRIVGRSLLYTALTALVATIYAAVVVLLGIVAGRGPVVSGVGAVVAAIAVAPLRAVAQRAVDRLLFGRRAEPFAVVSELNRRLQEAASPATALQVLVRTVAGDLRLPFVAVESREGHQLAAHGSPTPAHCVRKVLTHQGEPVGALVLGLRRGEDTFGARERVLLEDLARHAGATVRSAVLVRDLLLVRHRLVATREEERRRLRRDLHDGLGPQLTATTLKIDAARNLLRDDPVQADAILAELRADVRTALDDLRRVVYALRPPGLDDLGLLGALRQHAVACTTNGTTLTVRAGGDVAGLPAPVEVAAFRIATEAMTNAVRHAGARRCDVYLERADAVTLVITDDGIGIQPDRPAGVGITSMRERAAELGGTCTVESAGHAGTTVTAQLPLAEAAP